MYLKYKAADMIDICEIIFFIRVPYYVLVVQIRKHRSSQRYEVCSVNQVEV
jgi:hypothetical protein